MSIFGQDGDGSFQKQEEAEFPKRILDDLEVELSQLQEENQSLKKEVESRCKSQSEYSSHFE